jgi:hypothetical protein
MSNENKRKSIQSLINEANSRDLKKVPFVEMSEGRLQGVVSSGSDLARVYISYFDKASHDYHCSTNNNRPCGGLRGKMCKHLTSLLDEAVKQYGAKQVISYLGLEMDSKTIKKGSELAPFIKGSAIRESVPTVFSRFLSYLKQLDLENSNEPINEMDWFIMPGGDL